MYRRGIMTIMPYDAMLRHTLYCRSVQTFTFFKQERSKHYLAQCEDKHRKLNYDDVVRDVYLLNI